eukprot:gb/GFBE01079458.1/.p1 GENE.gb/GFBE01079458.1/~~gb/GFBE01079458.1/.p1  ORF type:complete len:307 (+),score=54.45 gb/GFBE01079458.1/:1-921(+)
MTLTAPFLLLSITSLALHSSAEGSAALDLDDECSSRDADGDCALNALQLQASKSGCDCSWTNGGANCGANDGSGCWQACCGHGEGGAALSHASCSRGAWTIAYSPDHCHRQGDALIVSCNDKVGSQCGTRLSSSAFVGAGTHSVGIKAAPGAGVATTFYLSNNGGLYDKTRTHPWVELDFEIMGNMAGPSSSKIWTNMFTGIAVEHNQWITVPFDVTADYHTFAFVLDETSVSWTVDGVTYRKEDITMLGDVASSIRSSKLQEFVSVWGKSSSDPGEGIPEFQAGLGKLDHNPNHFPIYAGFKIPN